MLESLVRFLSTLVFAWLACLLSLFMAHAAQAATAPRIGVMTMQPGAVFWERFGHDAIVVDNPATHTEPVSYNFGFFDMGEPDFVARFIRGEMRYQLVALPLSQDLAYYRDVGRGVSIQWLNVSAAQAADLAAALELNARPENARYRYDYFTDNCATRVRDALDRALGGALRRQWDATSQGNTYRGEAVRLASPAFWMGWGFDIGLGPLADRPLTRWQDGFVPMRLADALRDTHLPDGHKLVASEQLLLPHRLPPEPVAYQRAWWRWLVAGLALAAVMRASQARAPRLAAATASVFWLLCGVLGMLMAYLWLGTDHRAGWANHNLLLLNPFCLLLLPGAVRLMRARAPTGLFHVVLAAVAVCAVIAVFILWLPLGQPQRNAHWVALLVPLHMVLWKSWARLPVRLARG